MEEAAEAQEYERAAKYRDLISTVEQLQEKQRIAAVEGDDAGRLRLSLRKWHAGGESVPHARRKVLDRREFFWEDLPETAKTTQGRIPGSTEQAAEQSSANSAVTISQTATLEQPAFIPANFSLPS